TLVVDGGASLMNAEVPPEIQLAGRTAHACRLQLPEHGPKTTMERTIEPSASSAWTGPTDGSASSASWKRLPPRQERSRRRESASASVVERVVGAVGCGPRRVWLSAGGGAGRAVRGCRRPAA